MALIDPDLRPSSVRSADVIQPSGRPQGLQETFLSDVGTNRVPLTVFPLNGVKLQGVLTAFDLLPSAPAGRGLTTGLQARDLDCHANSTDPALSAGATHQDEDASKPAPRRPVVEIRRR